MAPDNFFNREKGTIILMSSSYEGRGYHSLIAETGAKLYRDPKKNSNFPSNIWFFSPNLSESDLHHFYPKKMRLFNEWDKLIEELSGMYKNPNVVIVPTSIQIPEQ